MENRQRRRPSNTGVIKPVLKSSPVQKSQIQTRKRVVPSNTSVSNQNSAAIQESVITSTETKDIIELFTFENIINDSIEYKNPYVAALADSKILNLPPVTTHIKVGDTIDKLEQLCRSINNINPSPRQRRRL